MCTNSFIAFTNNIAEHSDMATAMCYNRGCGKDYRIKDNHDEACLFHPGEPYFHDAYKGWTCCQAKSTDFTTFLNTPGCTVGKHSKIKPKESEKITGNLNKEEFKDEVIEVRPPIAPAKERVSVDSPTQRLTPTVAASLLTALKNVKKLEENMEDGEVKEGDCCKNNGCKVTYPPTSDECKYHPGFPVFHEVSVEYFTSENYVLNTFSGHEILVVLSEKDLRISTFSRSRRLYDRKAQMGG